MRVKPVCVHIQGLGVGFTMLFISFFVELVNETWLLN